MSVSSWPYLTFWLIVTGDGEEQFLHTFFKDVSDTGKCCFRVMEKVSQRRAYGDKRRREYLKTGKDIPKRDSEVGAKIRKKLNENKSYHVIWIDDLEGSRRATAADEFLRMREAGDTMLNPVSDLKERFSVHFLVNMLEAYYFADPESVQQAMNVAIQSPRPDVEEIPHPKNLLKTLVPGFDEKAHGRQIVPKLKLGHILNNPGTCKALRTLVAWCWERIGESRTERFQLRDGAYWSVTAGQLNERSRNEPLTDSAV